MLSHIVNITVHSDSITWCKLCQQLDDSYCTEMQKAALLIYTIHPFQKHTLDRIHSYTFTSDLAKKKKIDNYNAIVI